MKTAAKSVLAIPGAVLIIASLPFVLLAMIGVALHKGWRALELWAVYSGDADVRDRAEWKSR